ncbi:MAG TPA: hypothetical protein VKB85_11695 [Propionibacteriaceae bacterium]|nr:hypothetical protein [Propionibacteriaceae bacterium]
MPDPKGERTGKAVPNRPRSPRSTWNPDAVTTAPGQVVGCGQVVGLDSREPLDDHRVGARVIIGIAQPAQQPSPVVKAGLRPPLRGHGH